MFNFSLEQAHLYNNIRRLVIITYFKIVLNNIRPWHLKLNKFVNKP